MRVFADDTTPSVQLEAVQKERALLASALKLSPSSSDASGNPTFASDGVKGAEAILASDSLLAQHEAKLRQQLDQNQKSQDIKLLVEEADPFEPDESKPYSFLKLDSLRDAQESEVLKETTLTNDLKSAKQRVELAKVELLEKQKAAENARTAGVPLTDQPSIGQEHELKLAKYRLGLRQTELELVKGNIEICELTQKLLKAKIAVYEKGAKFSIEDRESKISELKKAESALQPIRLSAEVHIEKLVAMQSRLSKQPADNLVDENALRSLSDAVEMCQTLAVHSIQLSDCLVDAQSLWKNRYELQKTKKNNLTNLKDRKSSLDDLLERIDSYLAAIHQKQEWMLSRSNYLNNKNEVREGMQEAILAYEEARHFVEVSMVKCIDQLHSLKSPLTRFRKELRESISKNSTVWNSNPIELMTGIFSYELVEVDDEAVPVYRALLLLFLIALGIYLSVLISKFIARFLFPFFGIKPGVSVALRSIVRYALCIVSVMWPSS